MGLGRLKHGLLIQFKRYVDQLTGSSESTDEVFRNNQADQAHDVWSAFDYKAT